MIVVMATTSLADAKSRLSEIISTAERTHERTVITKNGRPAAVIMSVDDLDSLEETLWWLSQPGTREAVEEADREEFVSGDEVRRTLQERGIPLPEALA